MLANAYQSACWLIPKSSVCVKPALRMQKRCRSNQCCFSSICEQTVSQRIQESQLRRRQKLSDRVGCPGCSQKSLAPKSLLNHVKACCPDLIRDQHEWNQALTQPIQKQRLQTLLQAAEGAQRQAEQQVLNLTFRQVDATGESIRQGPRQVAEQLHLPEARVERLLRAGIKNTPMPGDAEAVQVLWEDEWLIAVNKPPRLNSTPMHRHVGNSMVNRLITHLGGSVPKVVHRLDMDTSGVLLFAKHSQVAADMHQLFRARHISKQYLAICVGVPGTAHSGSFSGYMEGSWLRRGEQVGVRAPVARHPSIGAAAWLHPSGKPAQTIFRVLDCSETVSWEGEPGEAWFLEAPPSMQGACVLLAEPLTGRTHQIRLHAAAAGLPLVGDNLYGLKVTPPRRQCLHAYTLAFQHPVNGVQMKLTAPVPPDMLQLLTDLKLQVHAPQ